MEIRLLKYFLAVAREQNITRAAQVLHITQPTLSRQIHQLEEELQAELFDRSSRKLQLTEQGLLLKKRAEDIVEIAQRAKLEISEISEDEISGRIVIGAGAFTSSYFMGELIAGFKKAHPKVSFEIITDNSDNIVERMRNGIVDIGLLLGPFDKEAYNSIELPIKERWGITTKAGSYSDAKRSISPEDMKNMPIIISNRHVLINIIKGWMGGSFSQKNIMAASTMPFNSAVLVEKGLGNAVGLEGAADLYDPKRFRFIPFEPELLGITCFAWRNQLHSRAVEGFLEYINAYIGKKGTSN